MSDPLPAGIDLNAIESPGVYLGSIEGDSQPPEPIPFKWSTNELFGYKYGTHVQGGMTTHWMKKLPDGEWKRVLPPQNPHPNGPRP